MGEPLRRARHVGLGGIRRQWRFGGAQNQIAANACGQVQHDIDTGCPDVIHHLAEQFQLARRFARLGVANMDMRDGGARLGTFDGRVRDLARRDRHLVRAMRGGSGAGDGSGDEYFAGRL